MAIKKKTNEVAIIELLYLCSSSFRDDVKKLREDFGIKAPTDGLFSVEDYVNFDVSLIQDSQLKITYDKAVWHLCRKYGLLDFVADVETYIESGLPSYEVFSEARSITTKITRPIVHQRGRYGDMPKEFGAEVVFTVRRYILTKDLDNWYKTHKAFLLTVINDYFAGYKPSVTQIDKLERVLFIFKLRQSSPKKTFKEIADQIAINNPDDPDVVGGKVNEQSVKMIYYRYKKRFEKLHR